MSNTISNEVQVCQNWYEKDYMSRGFDAQRIYPNKEFLRFMGRNYFSLPYNSRRSINLIELGCGSCANSWMVIKEGSNAHSVDLSTKAISLARNMIDKWCGGGGRFVRRFDDRNFV